LSASFEKRKKRKRCEGRCDIKGDKEEEEAMNLKFSNPNPKERPNYFK